MSPASRTRRSGAPSIPARSLLGRAARPRLAVDPLPARCFRCHRARRVALFRKWFLSGSELNQVVNPIAPVNQRAREFCGIGRQEWLKHALPALVPSGERGANRPTARRKSPCRRGIKKHGRELSLSAVYDNWIVSENSPKVKAPRKEPSS